MTLKLIYQIVAKLLSWIVLHARSDTTNEIEILVLRHHWRTASGSACQARHNGLCVPRTVSQPLIGAFMG